MSFQRGFACILCGNVFSVEEKRASCPSCGGRPIVDYDYESIGKELSRDKITARPSGVWRYQELLPVLKRRSIVSLGEGDTYLHRATRLGEKIGLRNLLVKDETTNPTGSFVDRGVTVEVSKAKELGYYSTVCGTTGNLGASVAAYSAKAGLKCRIFLPRRIDVGKFYQMIAFGADVEAARDYEEAFSKASSLGDRSYLASPADPYFLEGLKTTGYEICEQIGWKLPRNIVVPMGDGGHLSMIWRGINELTSIGFLDQADVRMIGVQAQGAAPIVKAFLDKETHVKPLRTSRTLAPDIDIKRPIHGDLAIKALTQSKGIAMSMPDGTILDAASLLAKTEGIFTEPASASTIASLRRLVDDGDIDKNEVTVCVLTGMGLKDPSSAKRLIKGRKRVEKLFERFGEHTIAAGITGTKLHILRMLSENKCHGYGLWKNLRTRYELQISLPSVYQHLNELETMKLIERTSANRESGRQRQYYIATHKGKMILKGTASA